MQEKQEQADPGLHAVYQLPEVVFEERGGWRCLCQLRRASSPAHGP